MEAVGTKNGRSLWALGQAGLRMKRMDETYMPPELSKKGNMQFGQMEAVVKRKISDDKMGVILWVRVDQDYNEWKGLSGKLTTGSRSRILEDRGALEKYIWLDLYTRELWETPSGQLGTRVERLSHGIPRESSDDLKQYMDWRDRKGNQHGPVENNDQKRRNSELEAFGRLWPEGDF